MRKCTLCVVHTPIKGAADKISLLLIKQIKIFAWRQTANCKEKNPKMYFWISKILPPCWLHCSRQLRWFILPIKTSLTCNFLTSSVMGLSLSSFVCFDYLIKYVILNCIPWRRTKPINLNLQLILRIFPNSITMNKIITVLIFEN